MQGAIPDHAAAQQRGDILRVAIREPYREVRADGHPRRIAAVDVPAGEARLGAQILAPGAARVARITRRCQPERPRGVANRPVLDAVADLRDAAHDLVAGNDGQAM